MTFSPPPDENTEQSENTDNQGEENEGDEDEGDENQGDDQGDENQGDENQGDENQGDENDGDDDGNDGDDDDNNDGNDGNDGDGNDGDGNDGDGNDGDDNDETTGGVVPSDKVTEWGESVWQELNGTYGTDAVKADFMYSDGLLYFCNGEGSGFKFSTSNSVYRVQLAGAGSTTKCCLQFKVSTNGTLYVDALSSSEKDVRTLNVYVNEDTVGEGISMELSTATREVKSLEVTTVSGETTISVASKSGGINVFTLKWTPTGVE